MNYISVRQAAEKWGVSDRRIRILCAEGKIEGVHKDGRAYLIPEDVLKPIDGRTLRGMEIPKEYAARFAQIDAMKVKLDKRRLLTPGEIMRLRKEFMVDFTYNSNAIEGNTLTLKETEMVLEGVTIDRKPLKDHLEAVGHRDAFLYLQQLITDKVPFTEKIIKDIHSLILIDRPEDRGVYRRIPVRIMGAYHEPPQPYLVAPQMEQFVSELEKTKKHPIESAALFHLKFEGIHPFIDGNGRTGRLVLNFTLMQHGYPPINVKFSDRKRYYDCFDLFYRDGNAGQMVVMVTEYVEEALKNLQKMSLMS